MALPLTERLKESVRTFLFEVRHFGTKPGTPISVDFPPEAGDKRAQEGALVADDADFPFIDFDPPGARAKWSRR